MSCETIQCILEGRVRAGVAVKDLPVKYLLRSDYYNDHPFRDHLLKLEARQQSRLQLAAA